ncbi:MAG: hypothetical protein KF851_09305 [Pirellulaceae bacterium]|nr:hypothetical protein [Pirellulaceae bacterium]
MNIGWSKIWFRVLAVCWASLVGLSNQPAQGQAIDSVTDDTQKMVQGLRDRGLFDLADLFANRWLEKKDIDPVTQANLVIEQVRTQMARAIQIPLPERNAAWDAAQTVAEDFLGQNPQHPRRAMIEIQQALALQAEGRLISAEKKVGAVDATIEERGLRQLREARKRLEQIERDLKRLFAQAPDKPTKDGRLTNEQLHSIAANTRFQAALTSLELAGYYPPDDRLNRIDVLISVVSRLEETISQVDAKNVLAISAKLRLIEAWRMMGNFADAQRALKELPVKNLPDDLQQLFWEQSLLLAVDQGQPRSALSVVEALENAPGLKPTTQMALLQLLFALAANSNESERGDWLRRATNLIGRIEGTQGNYWARLAERTLVQHVGSGRPETMAGSDSESLDMVARVGDAAFREERWEDALRAYESAVVEALVNQEWSVAYTVGFKSAQASEKLRQHQAAADRLLEIVARAPDDPYAPPAHLRAIWNVSQLGQDAEQKSRFHDLLQEHLQKFPASETRDQARLWLARYQLAEGQTAAALENYLQIPPTSTIAPQASRDLRAAIPRHLSELRAQSATVATKAAERISRELLTRLQQSAAEDTRLTESDSHLALALTPLVNEFKTADDQELARYLELARLIPGAVQTDWYVFNSSALISLYAQRSEQQSRAGELIAEIQTNPAALLNLYELLSKQQAASQPTPKLLGEWLNRTTAALEATSSDPAQRGLWQMERAKLLLAAGEHAEARAILEPLAAASPNRLDIQIALARALAASSETHTQALDQWRRVSAKTKEQSDDWFEARYEIARLLFETGQKDRAAEVLRFMQAVPPGWTQSKKRSDFDALFEKVSR